MADELLPTDPLEVVDAETEFDLAWPTIPLEDDPHPPEEFGLDLVDDLDDFSDEGSIRRDPDDEPDETEEGEDFEFDFGAEEFVLSVIGDPLRVRGRDAVLAWGNKALATEKGEYAIYPPKYGNAIKRLLSQQLPPAVFHAEASRALRECLAFHPRTRDVEVVNLVRRPDIAPNALFALVDWTLDDDDTPVRLQVRL